MNPPWSVLFKVNLVLLVLVLLNLLFVSPGTGAYVVTWMSIGVITLSLAGLALVSYAGFNPFNWR